MRSQPRSWVFGVRQPSPQHVEYGPANWLHAAFNRFTSTVPADPGLDALAVDFGPGGRELSALPGVDLRLVSGIDHVLSGRHMREIALREISGFLK